MFDLISKLFEEHPGMAIGLIIGLILGIIFLLAGFWKTIIFCAFIAIGLYFGKKFDADEKFKDIIEEFIPDKFFK